MMTDVATLDRCAEHVDAVGMAAERAMVEPTPESVEVIPARVERGWKWREDPFGERRHSCTVILPGGRYANAFASVRGRKLPAPLFAQRAVAVVDCGTHYEVQIDPRTGGAALPG